MTLQRFSRKIALGGVLGAPIRLFSRVGVLGERGFQRDLLITGCGSSGTAYVANLLNSNGVAVVHDFGLGRDGIVTNACDGQFVWLFSHKRGTRRVHVQAKIAYSEFTLRIRLVRHPLKVIGSVLEKWRTHGMIWTQVRETMNSLNLTEPYSLVNGCRYWLDWNQRLVSVTHDTLRIEDITQKPKILFDRIGRRLWRTHELQRVDKTNPSGAGVYPTWDQIKDLDLSLHNDLRDMARSLGYLD